MKKYTSTAETLGPPLFWLGIILIWEAAVNLGYIQAYILPSPSKILTALWNEKSLIGRHLGATLSVGFSGLFAGVTAGLGTALVLDAFPKSGPYLRPLLTLSQTLPPFLVYPIILMVFGLGYLPRILLSALVCYFPIAVGFSQGLKETDPDHQELLTSMGASRLQSWIHLRFPSALPSLAGGIKIALAYSVVGVVFAEMMGGPMEGLGFYMTRKMDVFEPSAVWAAVLLMTALTLALISLAAAWANRLLNNRKRSDV